MPMGMTPDASPVFGRYRCGAAALCVRAMKFLTKAIILAAASEAAMD
jgi:hypothetical protein